MLIIAALYHFTRFDDPAALRGPLMDLCQAHGVKGSLLLPREGYTPGLIYEAMIGEETPHVRLDELLERGEDYDRVRVTWLKGQGPG